MQPKGLKDNAPGAPELVPPGVAICVDLDGTLVKSDTLFDSLLALLRKHPEKIMKFPRWSKRGRAGFKEHLTRAVKLDVEHLPYNRPLLAWLRQQHAAGRKLYLATAADCVLAERVAAYLGIFAGVMASDGETNLAGINKLSAFRARFGQDFCYIGNASPDAPLLAACTSPMVANPHKSLLRSMQRSKTVPIMTFDDQTPSRTSWFRALRLHQWAKNALIFVPLLLGHAWRLPTLLAATLAFLSFGLVASATYIINDLLDIEADRRHLTKRRRPFAAGDLSPISGIFMVIVCLVLSPALIYAVPRIAIKVHFPMQLDSAHRFLMWLAIYTVTTLLYSFYLKRKLLLDVFVLSLLYTIRMLAGSAATGIEVSTFLSAFSVFFFLSLAFVKRFSELEGLRERGDAVSNGRGYFVGDLDQLRALGTGAMYAAVVVLAIYINDTRVTYLYRYPIRLWLAVLVLLLWLSQIWMLTSRGEMHDDPVVFAITDKRSLLLGGLMAAIIYWAT